MRPELYVDQILSGKVNENEKVNLHGWVYNTRSSGKKVKFILFRDGTGILQGVLFKGSCSEKVFDRFSELSQETSIALKGTVVKAANAPGGWEMQVEDFDILGSSENYPITPKEHGPAFLQDHRHLWIRSKKQMATLRIRSEIIFAAREFLHREGFVSFDAPIFTPNACEGTTDLFEVDYFEENKAYLTQSGQLYGEAGATALGKVFVFGPCFRAEKSKTRRHLTEFWMLEPEVAFMDLKGTMELAEELISYVVKRVLETRTYELQALERDLTKLEKIKAPFERMHYKEAADILLKESKDGFKMGNDFGGGDETILASKFEKPLFVHSFPSAIKAFYMKEDPEDPTYSCSVDLIAPEGYGEIIGGGQREESIKVLEQKIQEHKLPEEAFKWYLDLRRFGSVPHSGFGVGIERLTSWICGSAHVRECVPFPRTLYRLSP